MKILYTYFFRVLLLMLITSANAFAQPANNECAGALPTTMNLTGSCAATTNVVTTGATLSAPTGFTGTFCAPTSGNDDVWYTVTTNAGQTGINFTVTNIVATSGTVTSIGYSINSGTCTGLTQIACLASGVTTTASITGLSPSTTYYFRTWTGAGANSGTYTLCFQEPPSSPPNCATNLAPAGSTVTLLCGPSPSSVIFTWTAPATGPAPTGYKFYLGTGVPALLGTVTSTTATIFNLLPNTAYNWYVVPTNGLDAVGCNTPLTFTTGPEPACVANNSCSSATPIGVAGNPGSVSSTTTGATISMVAEVCATATGTADDDVWFSFTTDSDGGDVVVALTGAAAALDAVMHAYSGACGSLVNIGCADATVAGGSETVTLTGLAANTVYYVRVYGYGAFSATTPTSGAFTLTTSGTGVTGVVTVSMTNLKAVAQKDNAVMSWQTNREFNNKGFEILKSYDAVQFSKIGFVNGSGNAADLNNYSFTDYKIREGILIYYRLRQIDLDGNSKLSEIVSVRLNKKAPADAFVYPNPAKNIVNVTFNDPVTDKVQIRITDPEGQVLLTQTVARGSVNVPLNISNFSVGNYFIIINENGKTSRLQFVKAAF